jgi:hypothetical protein
VEKFRQVTYKLLALFFLGWVMYEGIRGEDLDTALLALSIASFAMSDIIGIQLKMESEK